MKTKGGTDGKTFAQSVGRALRRAAKAARKSAQVYNAPVYVWLDGKGVATKPWEKKRRRRNRDRQNKPCERKKNRHCR